VTDLEKAMKYITELENQRAELKEKLRVATLELEAHKKLGGEGVVMITSLVSHRTEKPRVDIQLGNGHAQMEADQAIEVATQIIKCATGAHADAFLFHFVKHELQQPDNVSAGILDQFRTYREQLAQKFEAST